jgi:hypothetical protein
MNETIDQPPFGRSLLDRPVVKTPSPIPSQTSRIGHPLKRDASPDGSEPGPVDLENTLLSPTNSLIQTDFSAKSHQKRPIRRKTLPQTESLRGRGAAAVLIKSSRCGRQLPLEYPGNRPDRLLTKRAIFGFPGECGDEADRPFFCRAAIAVLLVSRRTEFGKA